MMETFSCDKPPEAGRGMGGFCVRKRRIQNTRRTHSKKMTAKAARTKVLRERITTVRDKGLTGDPVGIGRKKERNDTRDVLGGSDTSGGRT